MTNDTLDILVIDDDRGDRAFCRRTLKSAFGDRLRYAEADGGENGLEAMDARVPDCVLLDHVMPGIDGPTLLKKARGFIGSAPVMFISGYAEAEFSDILEGETGVTFLPKPLDIKILAERVKQQLQAA